MEFPKLLLHIGLILATITDFCIAKVSKINYRLPDHAIPVDYNISLIPHLEEGKNTFHGEISVTVDIVYQRNYISLHSQELEINKSATTLVKGYDLTKIYKPTAHTYDDEINVLTLHFDDKLLNPGIYTLNMMFVGKFSQGGYLSKGFMKILYTDEGEDRTLAATLFEPDQARRMFPCWDEPEIKAYFMISVKHPQEYKVLSNWPMREEYNVENGMMWTHFERTYTMSAYLVGIVIASNFVRIGNTDQSINVWCNRRQDSCLLLPNRSHRSWRNTPIELIGLLRIK